ncbi:MAG: hypothetical protein KDA78_21540, partial [Planctomycetaceae bacterium]|nr:hypothetical protein [Planctomycetaceae bacterium]
IHEPVVIDRPNLKEMTDEELDSKVLEFCESGHRMDAVQLLRKYRGYSLSEAKRMTDELC